MRTRRLAIVACVALLLLGGCRDRSTAQDKRDKLCEEVAELDGTVTRLAALEPSAATGAEVRELRARLEAQHRDVEEAAEDADDVRVEPVNQAYNNVVRSVSGVNDQATLIQAQSQIDQAAGDFSNARVELHSSARC